MNGMLELMAMRMSCFLFVYLGRTLLIEAYISLLMSYAIGFLFRDNDLKAKQPSVWSSFVKPWKCRKVRKDGVEGNRSNAGHLDGQEPQYRGELSFF